MNGLGEGVAFAGLAIAAAVLTANGHNAVLLWAVILVWCFFSDWGQDKKK